MPLLDTPEGQPDDKVAWGSDVAAQMLRLSGVKYVSLNPGASYRGLHDSIVNHLGNRDPGMLLCLHEDHAIGVAHGYAKATDEPMGAIVHSNVGLMHGHMAIFNAFCDRVPMIIMGATGPVDSHQRRPWIDWIHTSQDQAGIVRDILKFDVQPSSAEAIVDGMLRANIATRTEPCAPVYIVLDAGLQESSLDREIKMPDMTRFKAPASPRATAEDIATMVSMIKAAKRPMILYGRGTRSQKDWDARVQLAETIGACVMTDLKNGSVFPTDHPAHVIEPFNQPAKKEIDIVAEADLVLAFEWIDLGGMVCPPKGGSNVTAKVVKVSMDHHLHNGAHTVYQLMSPSDLLVSASSEAVIADLNAALAAAGMSGKKDPWREATRRKYGPNEGKIRMADVALELRKNFADPDKVSFAGVARGWPCDLWPFRNPGAYMGKDGGGGIGSGPSISVGVALANSDKGRETVAVLGDGDFLMGGHAIFTAVKHQIPILFVINNNQSYFNDELHQETVAKRRNRPVANRWIGQAITPGVDIAKFVESQGAVGIGPIKDMKDLPAAIQKGVEAMRAGKVALVDVHIPPADRGTSSTGLRNT